MEVPLPDINVPVLCLPDASAESTSASPPKEIWDGIKPLAVLDESPEHDEEISEHNSTCHNVRGSNVVKYHNITYDYTVSVMCLPVYPPQPTYYNVIVIIILKHLYQFRSR